MKWGTSRLRSLLSANTTVVQSRTSLSRWCRQTVLRQSEWKQLGLRTQSEWRSLVDDAARRIIILQLLVWQCKFTFSNNSWHAAFFIFCLQMLLLWFDVGAFTGGGWEGRLSEEGSCKRMRHLLSDQLIETLSCNGQVSNRRGRLLCIFLMKYIPFKDFALKCQDLDHSLSI